MADEPTAAEPCAPSHCHIIVLGACHSAADELAAALDYALAAPQTTTIPRYSVVNASERWLAEEGPGPQPHTPACWLLSGLDLPCPEALRTRQQCEDAWLRTQLASAGLIFRVVYGATPTSPRFQ